MADGAQDSTALTHGKNFAVLATGTISNFSLHSVVSGDRTTPIHAEENP
jgi:hypothetical protein